MFRAKDDLSSPSPLLSQQGTDMVVTHSESGMALKRVVGGSYDNGFLSVPFVLSPGTTVNILARKVGAGSAFFRFGLTNNGLEDGIGFSFGQNEITVVSGSAGVMDVGLAQFDKYYHFGFKVRDDQQVDLYFSNNKVVTLPSPAPSVRLALGASFYEQLSVEYKNLKIKA